MSKCPVCLISAKSSSPSGYDGEEINCPRCGNFKISGSALAQISLYFARDERDVANASGWIREHQGAEITSITIDLLKELPTPTYEERKRKLLFFFQRQSKTLGESVIFDAATIQRAMGFTWSSSKELWFLIISVEADGLVSRQGDTNFQLSAKGYDYLALQNINPASQIGFCAMWFDASVNPLWHQGIDPAIHKAGYQPLRIDQKEHVNRIDDEIFADIRRSRFVVADFTHGEGGVRGGVYFEAGFAQGLGLPVIWTCRSDMLSEAKLHFDIRQYNFLEWSEDTLDDFSDRLQKRIEAILGRGTWKPE